MQSPGFIGVLAILIFLESFNMNMKSSETDRIATFGAGCFWCTEAVFERLEGVEKVVSGYSGGSVKNPTYREVTGGRTGHAEVCQVHYNPDIISYEELLEVFWHTHDPTTLNRQGNDVGSQYRSVILYHSEEQKRIAEGSKASMDASGTFSDPIVTEITEFSNFYKAEDYHQDYFRNNPSQPYCTFIVKPKIEKFRAKFQYKLKQ
jgi:peptide-methionine (S)-S-oxide reductase